MVEEQWFGRFLTGKYSLSTGITSVDQIEVADLDNDSDLDTIAASSDSSFKAWLENDGTDGFTPLQLN